MVDKLVERKLEEREAFVKGAASPQGQPGTRILSEDVFLSEMGVKVRKK